MTSETRPLFNVGDIVANGHVSMDSPRHVGMIKAVRSREGRLNAGRYYEISDFRGDQWEVSAEFNMLSKVGFFDLIDGPRNALAKVKADMAEAAAVPTPTPPHGEEG
ncbi:MAG: hypothetical protein FD152_543 [Xanthobacteraceae bacterium]|nr:MAG: hypothetical protein FD152_543 [Xanthobacteraceae bacterium]